MHSKVEEVSSHHWVMDEALPGASVWPWEVGFLQGFGKSRRQMVLKDFIPHVVVSGRGHYRGGGQELEVEAGDVFTLWPDVAYEFFESPEAPWSFYWFRLRGAGIEGFGRACGFGPDKLLVKPRRPERVVEAVRSLFELFGEKGEREPCRALELLFRFAAALREETGVERGAQTGLARQAGALLEASLERGFNVNELCGRLRVSRSALLMAFKSQLGTTPQAHLAQLRLRRAEELLLRSDWKLSTIAAACGFHGEKYFLRAFKESHGLTPSQWRAAQPT